MVTFSSFSNILPDPLNPITDAGSPDAAGTPGPGFSAVNFSSVTDTQVSRTVSGRGVPRDGGSQHWEFTISYNPMFRAQFDPVDAFLTGRNPRRDPFYVILPQYSKPKDPTFAAFASLNTFTTAEKTYAGARTLLVGAGSAISSSTKPGDMFTISDPTNVNHQKVYKVARVETNSYYQAGTTQPSTSQMRIHIAPPLERTTETNSVINFIRPKFRVVAKSDVQEHSLDTNNLYSFSLPVEELQP